MPLVRDSIVTIVKRIEKGIEARLFGKHALLRTAVLRILARVFAGAIHGCYGYLEWLKDQLFVTTAEEWYLINVHGVIWGIARRSGSFASGTVIFTGTDGIIIPPDTRLQNEDGIEYGTTAIGTITGGMVAIDIQAIETGGNGNFVRPNPPDPIYLQLISPISNVEDQVEINGDITGGEDIEDLEVYRSRILQRIRTTPAGGNTADYDRWASSYAGVARAWCYPIANGPGTVTEVITATGEDPVPSSTLISEVQAYMNDLKPVTADLTVASITNYFHAPGKTVLGFSIDLYEDTSGSGYQESIKSNLRTLFLPHRPGTTIPISQIRAAISNSGAKDYKINNINADGVYLAVDNIVLTGYQYPWLGAVNFGVL